MTIDTETVRTDFPILQKQVQGNPLLYLDNAATSLTPTPVIDAATRFYTEYNANVHRGIHTLSEEATNQFEQVREQVADFINAPSPENIVYSKGTTESINTVAHGLRRHVSASDNVVVSVLEHHSNLVPWQELCNETGAELRYIEMDDTGRIDTAHAENMIDDNTVIAAVSHLSNVTGAVNDIAALTDIAHGCGARILVDGAQAAPHLPVDVNALDVDFYVFSGHKMLGPTGVGVLYGTEHVLEELDPLQYGGSMIHAVHRSGTDFADPPTRFEGGTPNIAGVFGLGAAVEYLTDLGMGTVQQHSAELAADIHGTLVNRFDEQVTVYGGEHQVGIVSFTLEQLHPHDLASLLDMNGVAVRAGHHCTQPLHDELGVAATVRASTYLYNTAGEVDRFEDAVSEAVQVFTQ